MMRWMAAAVMVMALAGGEAAGQTVARLRGTSENAFDIGLGVNRVRLLNTGGVLELPAGLIISGGALSLDGATIDAAGGSLDDCIIGGVTPAAGTFTDLAADSLDVLAGTIDFTGSTISDAGSVTTIDINGGTIDGAAIGGSTPAAGAFTTVGASGQITSTVTTGTAPLVIASTTKVTNMNCDSVDGMSLTGGADGGVVYQSSSSGLTATAAGTSGQMLLSAGSSAPTWAGLSSANILVGNASNIPAAVSMSGDATISNTGAVTIAAGAVSGTKLSEAVADGIYSHTVSASAEVADVITVTITIKDINANTINHRAIVFVVLSDAANDFNSLPSGGTLGTPSSGQRIGDIQVASKPVYVTHTNGVLVIPVSSTGSTNRHINFAYPGGTGTIELDFN